MSKQSGKHMSAEASDKFEEEFEGEDFGTMDDWETDLGLKILTIEKKLMSPAGQANAPVNNMLQKKLATYNAALAFLDENPRAASQVGDKGGLQAITAYITKQALEDATRSETRKYSNLIIPHLSGYKLAREVVPGGGLVKPGVGAGAGRARAPIAVGAKAAPVVDGAKLLSF